MLASAGGKLKLQGATGNASSTGVLLEGNVQYAATNATNEVEIAADSLLISASGAVNAAGQTVRLRPTTNNKGIAVGGAGQAGELALPDTTLDQINAGTIIVGDGTARKISLTGNVTRSTQTDVRIDTKGEYIPGAFTIDAAGGRIDVPYSGPDTISESGDTLEVNLSADNAQLSTVT